MNWDCNDTDPVTYSNKYTKTRKENLTVNLTSEARKNRRKY